MFENQQRDEIEALMRIDAEFRRLYQQHKRLDSKVHNAGIGVLPIDEITLSSIKKKKLQVKQKLQYIWETRHRLLH